MYACCKTLALQMHLVYAIVSFFCFCANTRNQPNSSHHLHSRALFVLSCLVLDQTVVLFRQFRGFIRCQCVGSLSSWCTRFLGDCLLTFAIDVCNCLGSATELNLEGATVYLPHSFEHAVPFVGWHGHSGCC